MPQTLGVVLGTDRHSTYEQPFPLFYNVSPTEISRAQSLARRMSSESLLPHHAIPLPCLRSCWDSHYLDHIPAPSASQGPTFPSSPT